MVMALSGLQQPFEKTNFPEHIQQGTRQAAGRFVESPDDTSSQLQTFDSAWSIFAYLLVSCEPSNLKLWSLVSCSLSSNGMGLRSMYICCSCLTSAAWNQET